MNHRSLCFFFNFPPRVCLQFSALFPKYGGKTRGGKIRQTDYHREKEITANNKTVPISVRNNLGSDITGQSWPFQKFRPSKQQCNVHKKRLLHQKLPYKRKADVLKHDEADIASVG